MLVVFRVATISDASWLRSPAAMFGENGLRRSAKAAANIWFTAANCREKSGLASLDAARQRTADDQIESEGFADALDVGGL